jgi:tellurite resistance protein
MGLFRNLFAAADRAIANYSGDATFLHAAASAAANVVAADGKVEDAEVKAAIAGMKNNKTLSGSYTPSKIEEEVAAALDRAQTRSGRIQNTRAIEALASRPVELRQDIFLIAADTTDGNSNGLGAPEKAALDKIADALGLDADKLLG